jgi:hypothetical protein
MGLSTKDPISLIQIAAHSSGLNKIVSRVVIFLWLIQTVMPVGLAVPVQAHDRVAVESPQLPSDSAPLPVASGAGIGLPTLALTALIAAFLVPNTSDQDAQATEIVDLDSDPADDGEREPIHYHGSMVWYHKDHYYVFYRRQATTSATHGAMVSSPTIQGIKDSIANNDTTVIFNHEANSGWHGACMFIDHETDSAFFAFQARGDGGGFDTTWISRGALNPSTAKYTENSEHWAYAAGNSSDSAIYFAQLYQTGNKKLIVAGGYYHNGYERVRILSDDAFPTSSSNWTMDTMCPVGRKP